MTRKRHQDADESLESLYARAGNVEPDAGLDRIIRARAGYAAAPRSESRTPWIGGLVTASVAVIAIAVVIQQPSPERRAEPAAPERASKSSELHEVERSARPAPAADSASMQPPPPTRRRSEAEAPMEADRAAGLAEDRPLDATGQAMPQAAPEAVQPPPAARARVESFSTAQELDPAAMVAMIRASLEREDFEAALDWAARLEREHPDYRLPEDLQAALKSRRTEADSPD